MTSLSRRSLLSTLVGGGVLSRHLTAVLAQETWRVNRLDDGLDAIISASEPIHQLATGMIAEAGPAEGPLWWKEGGYLLFTDGGNTRRLKYTPGKGVTVFDQGTRSSGLTRDLEGRLVAAEQLSSRIARYELDGRVTIVADRYQGKGFNRPNDVVVRSDGTVYFTDPFSASTPQAQPVAGVYRVSPDLRTVSLVTGSIVTPNGLALSPDERTLYVADSRRREIRAFDILDNGLPADQTGRVFADLSERAPGNPDGLKVDTAGNVYCAGSGGIHFITAAGKKLGNCPFVTTNIGFGDDDWKTLYFTTRSALGSMRLKVAGLPVPAVRRR